MGLEKLIVEQKTLTPEQIVKTKNFQDWLDINYPKWVGCTNTKCNNGTNLNQGSGYGSWGNSTDNMWKFKYDGTNELKTWFNQNYDANNPTSVLTKKISGTSSNKELEVELFTRQFYFDGKTMSQLYNENDLKRLVEFTIRDANDLGISLAEAYIMFVYKLFNRNIQKISVPTKYSDIVSKMDLMEQLKGLENLLNEQGKKTHTTFVVKNGKLVSPPTTLDQSNVTLDTVVSSQGYVNLDGSVDGSLPEESPAVAEIKKKLGYTVETGNVMTDDFVKFLKNWQGQNQITPTGAIDYKTVIKLYPEKTPKVTQQVAPPAGEKPTTNTKTTTNVVTNENETNIKKALEKSVLSANRIMLPARGEDVNFEYCKDLFNYYPQEVRVLKKDLGIKVDITDEELVKVVTPIKNNVERAYKRCKAQYSTKTNLNRAGDWLNIFRKGSASFDNLDEPFKIES